MYIPAGVAWSFLNEKENELTNLIDDPVQIGKKIAYLEMRTLLVAEEITAEDVIAIEDADDAALNSDKSTKKGKQS